MRAIGLITIAFGAGFYKVFQYETQFGIVRLGIQMVKRRLLALQHTATVMADEDIEPPGRKVPPPRLHP